MENIFLCMVSPLLGAALCMGRRHLRFFLFCIVGMGVCLLSAYINTFLASVCQADADYKTGCKGETGFRETVRVEYDPEQVSLDALLLAYFYVRMREQAVI